MQKQIIRVCKNKHCKLRFAPMHDLQIVHNYHCALEYAKQLRERKENKEGKERRKRIKVMKEKIMTLSDYQKMLQPLVNHIARLIDHGQPCISCGKTTGKPQGGHYHSTNDQPSVRFNLHVIHLQDFKCNVWDSANITGYNKGLIEVYGNEYKEYVECGVVKEYPTINLSIPELKDAIKTAREIVKSMKEENKVRTPKERIRMRRVLNRLIGIYPK